MLFTSYTFVLFALGVAAVYYIVPGKLQNPLLLLASFYFYWYTMPKFLPLLVITGTVCYFAARLLENKELRFRKAAFIFFIILFLAPLFVYKYLGFFSSIASSLFGIGGRVISLALPLGISFYTFQAVGYIIDCYNGTVKAERNFINCLLFISFFPQLLSGPIGRAKILLPIYRERRGFSLKSLSEAGIRFISGMFKKMVIADNLGRFVDLYYSSPGSYAIMPITLLVVVLYAFQIYFDFAGYSDMAIAAGKLFGINLPENFDTPYLATNMSGYWKRWHMSLTTWLTDYIFIPLVWSRWGNKVIYGKKWEEKRPVTLANIAIVFLVSGLWHGAAYTFIIWGALHAVFRIVEELLHRWRKPKKKEPAYKVNLKRLVVFVASAFAHIFFRADSIGTALEVLRYSGRIAPVGDMLGATLDFAAAGLGGINLYTAFQVVVIALSFLLAVYLDLRMYKMPASVKERVIPVLALPEWVRVGIYVFMYLAIVVVGQFGTSNFIYFNF